MFWKKRRDKTDLIIAAGTTKREAYRYSPSDPQDIPCTFQGRKIQILNISAGGISFYNHEFDSGDSGDLTIRLEDAGMKKNITLSTRLTILSIGDNNVCHCSFEGLSLEDQEQIHHYLLIKQKQEIQKKKSDSTH